MFTLSHAAICVWVMPSAVGVVLAGIAGVAGEGGLTGAAGVGGIAAGTGAGVAGGGGNGDGGATGATGAAPGAGGVPDTTGAGTVTALPIVFVNDFGVHRSTYLWKAISDTWLVSDWLLWLAVILTGTHGFPPVAAPWIGAAIDTVMATILIHIAITKRRIGGPALVDRRSRRSSLVWTPALCIQCPGRLPEGPLLGLALALGVQRVLMSSVTVLDFHHSFHH